MYKLGWDYSKAGLSKDLTTAPTHGSSMLLGLPYSMADSG